MTMYTNLLITMCIKQKWFDGGVFEPRAKSILLLHPHSLVSFSAEAPREGALAF